MTQEIQASTPTSIDETLKALMTQAEHELELAVAGVAIHRENLKFAIERRTRAELALAKLLRATKPPVKRTRKVKVAT